MSDAPRDSRISTRFGVVIVITVAAVATGGSLVEMTPDDFMLPGTQPLDVDPAVFAQSDACGNCHGFFDEEVEPYFSWQGSLMGQAGRDPLFFAQMATANQDVANVGTFCLRCHLPMSFVTAHALQPDGSTLDEQDLDGVSCHFCHSMVDPRYAPGVSPPEDKLILAGMDAPQFYANSMFVLDPSGTRRGPREDAEPLHEVIPSPFHRTGAFCGTCHDVGNVAVTLQPDGSYRYNRIGEPTPTLDPSHQFPLERTYTEWKLSAYADGGVDTGGRFGGVGDGVVSTCQDCHMPRVPGRVSPYGPHRADIARHDFAGAAAQVLDLIAALHPDDPAVDQRAIAAGRAKAVSMLERAATLEVEQRCGTLRVRVVNESGHKLPTGHIEGRRVWVNVRFRDAGDAVVREHGHYDLAEAHLDEHSTDVYEMHVGLSDRAAEATGLRAGPTTHMALADLIVKDNRIPPRGYDRNAFASAGAPAVGAAYKDGQHWDDSFFAVPDRAVRAEVAVFYQNTPRHYIEALRDGNVTDHWGQTLYELWEATGRGAPIEMTASEQTLGSFVRGDLDCDGLVGIDDLIILLLDWGVADSPADLDGNRLVDVDDLIELLMGWTW